MELSDRECSDGDGTNGSRSDGKRTQAHRPDRSSTKSRRPTFSCSTGTLGLRQDLQKVVLHMIQIVFHYELKRKSAVVIYRN